MRRVLVLLLVLLCGPSVAQTHRGGIASGTTTWTRVPLGGGGYQIHIKFCPSGQVSSKYGSAVVATDVWGGYVLASDGSGGQVWQPLLTLSNHGAVPTSANDGLYDVACAPSRPTRIYIGFNNKVYRQDNGLPWLLTAFTGITGGVGGTANGKFYQNKIEIDPNNPDVVYVATPSGLKRTFDGGTTQEHVTAVPDSSKNTGNAGIQFDPNSGTTTCPSGRGTCTKNIFVGVYGTGMYYSTDGGKTWTASSGGPTTIIAAAIAPDGAYWAAANTNKGWKFTVARGWSSVTTKYPIVGVQPTKTTGTVLFMIQGNEQVISGDSG